MQMENCAESMLVAFQIARRKLNDVFPRLGNHLRKTLDCHEDKVCVRSDAAFYALDVIFGKTLKEILAEWRSYVEIEHLT